MRHLTSIGGTMVTKEILNQYADLLAEQKEVEDKIASLDRQIAKLQKRLNEIESGEIVKDRVYGGEGGIQGFNIEGVPSVEYSRKRAEMIRKVAMMNERKVTLRDLNAQISLTIIDVERFIASVNDSYMRRIINLRFVKKLSWNDVANAMGGSNNEDNIKKAFYRFMNS